MNGDSHSGTRHTDTHASSNDSYRIQPPVGDPKTVVKVESSSDDDKDDKGDTGDKGCKKPAKAPAHQPDEQETNGPMS
eukprot:13346680-Alexandrium_andersonii.AAC.1